MNGGIVTFIMRVILRFQDTSLKTLLWWRDGIYSSRNRKHTLQSTSFNIRLVSYYVSCNLRISYVLTFQFVYVFVCLKLSSTCQFVNCNYQLKLIVISRSLYNQKKICFDKSRREEIREVNCALSTQLAHKYTTNTHTTVPVC